jgi:F-type H+-transporting ATPase subunit delta
MSVLSLRYAHAFASVATASRLDTAAAQQQLHDFSETLAGSRELREVLMNPSIPGDQKLKVLDAIAGRIGMFPQVRNFLAVIMDHQRLDELEEILTEYHAVADEQANMAEAEITSARPLNDHDRAELEAEVAKLAGGRVRTTYHQDATLLGGAVVRIGSTVYDGSIRTQLQQLKQRLANA